MSSRHDGHGEGGRGDERGGAAQARQLFVRNDDHVDPPANRLERPLVERGTNERCRVFADCAEMQAGCDPNLKPIADAPQLPQDIPPPPPADHDGSAKVALLGIERSHAAWLELVHQCIASASDVEPFIADLIWLSDELERVFPKARVFVRPGLDELDEVARLLATEGGR